MTGGFAVLAAVGALTFSASAHAAPGDLDPSFGNGGHVAVPVFAPCAGLCVPEATAADTESLALQPDGKILLGGVLRVGALNGYGPARPSGVLVRLDGGGALDPSFGHAGVAEESPPITSHVFVLPDGELLVLGGFEGSDRFERFGIARFTAAGLLDQRNPAGGIRSLENQGVPGASVDRQGRPLLLEREARMGIEVRRFLSSGQPDVSFGSGGVALVPLPLAPADREATFATAHDGGIVVAYLKRLDYPQPEKPLDLVLARLNPDGSVDTSFGRDGVADTKITLSNSGLALAIAPDGRILAATTQEGSLELTQFSSAGRQSRLFGHGGVARFAPLSPYEAYDGQRVFPGPDPAAITFDAAGNALVAGEREGEAFLARYTSRGRDCSFGVHGLVVDPLIENARAVGVQGDGRIVIAGEARHHNLAFGAARFIGGTARTCRGEGVPAPTAKQPEANLGPVSVHVPSSPDSHSPVEIAFAPGGHLPSGGYYYAVVVLRHAVLGSNSSKPSCAVSSDMQKTSYGFPRRNHWVLLTLYPAPSAARQWCQQGTYEGAVYAVPHKPRCTKQYPCYVGRAAQCSYQEAESQACQRPVSGVVEKPAYFYSDPRGLPKPIDNSTKIVGYFRLRFE